jgi:REP element-mobilizing transposase RayT
LIIAYHAIFTTYGTWLPNDPRGSFSKEIYNAELKALGEIEYGRQDPQPPRKTIKRFWVTSAPKLSRRPYFINDSTRPIVAEGFAQVVERLDLIVHACAIMDDHVHMLVLRSKYQIEYLVNQFKGAATHALGLKVTPWTRGCWKVFVNDEGTFRSAVDYIEMNPIKAGLSLQNWRFVTQLPPV